MKISILYFSQTGNTEKVANFIKAGAETIDDTEVQLFNIKEWDSLSEENRQFINDSKAIVFGTPTYYANMCWQMKKFFDTDKSVKLAGKIGCVFATENSPNGGGGEQAILTVQQHLLVKGMLVYSSGTAEGNPYIHIGPAVVKDLIPEKEELCNIYGKRISKKAHELFD